MHRVTDNSLERHVQENSFLVNAVHEKQARTEENIEELRVGQKDIWDKIDVMAKDVALLANNVRSMQTEQKTSNAAVAKLLRAVLLIVPALTSLISYLVGK